MTITGFMHGTSADVPLQRIEVFTGIGGAVVRIASGTDSATIAAVIQALKVQP